MTSFVRAALSHFLSHNKNDRFMDEARIPALRVTQAAFDIALGCALFAAPLFMGGRGPLGKFVFIVFVSCMAAAWLVEWWLRPAKHRVVRWTGAEWIIGGGLLLVVAQLLPLPESILLTISPHMRDLLPIWFPSSDPQHHQIGQWQTISFAPDATRHALAVYLSYGLFFFLIVQRIQRVTDAERLLRWIAYGAIGLSVIGMAQFLFGNGKFLWVYEHPFRATERVVKGPFQNQNHFAQMMALSIGPLLWLLLGYLRSTRSEDHRSARSKRQGRRSHRGRQHPAPSFRSGSPSELLPLPFYVTAFGTGLIATSVMLTYSRGGFLAFVVAAATALAIFAWQRSGSRRFWISVACTASVVFVSVLIHGYDTLTNRLATLGESESLEELSVGRHSLWNAMAEAISLYWRGGTGFGSHADVYPLFMNEHYSVRFTHGESGYLPLFMEGGIFAIALLVASILLFLYWIWNIAGARHHQHPEANHITPFTAPLAAAIMASLVHSIGDFVWYITAPMSWTILMLAVAASVAGIARQTTTNNQPSQVR
ncbi:MAG: O-antigen ligase family protein [Pirellulaceae bacterium]